MSTYLPPDANPCTHCNVCLTVCPVAAVSPTFLGPKAVLGQAATPANECNGCGACSLACPHAVPVAALNVRSKGQQPPVAEQRSLLQRATVNHAGWYQRLSPLIQHSRNWGVTRWLLARWQQLHPQAPLPPRRTKPLPVWFAQHRSPAFTAQRKVLFFASCSNHLFESNAPNAAVQLLQKAGCHVTLAQAGCCGQAWQAQGDLATAQALAQQMLAYLRPFIQDQFTIVSDSPACIMALRHDYQAVLGVAGIDWERVASQAYEICEFLLLLHQQGQLNMRFRALAAHVFYHPACQQRRMAMPLPALALLAQIPNLQVQLPQAACCGAASGCGMQISQYPTARAVGESLFLEVANSAANSLLLCEDENCRHWCDGHHVGTGRSQHPAELLWQQLDQRRRMED